MKLQSNSVCFALTTSFRQSLRSVLLLLSANTGPGFLLATIAVSMRWEMRFPLKGLS